MKRYLVCLMLLMLAASTVLPVRASAQPANGGPTIDIERVKISLDLESSSLYYALKMLFSQVKCNFTIDESLKGLTVTAHFTDVPFRIALEALLKSTGTPLTYKVEEGIYSVIPKVEAPPAQEEPNISGSTKPAQVGAIHLIRVNNISDLDIVQAFGGTILNLGFLPGFGRGGILSGQNQAARQNNGGFFEGGQNLIATGHNQIIDVEPPAVSKQ